MLWGTVCAAQRLPLTSPELGSEHKAEEPGHAGLLCRL
jgi:hypothetical protein